MEMLAYLFCSVPARGNSTQKARRFSTSRATDESEKLLSELAWIACRNLHAVQLLCVPCRDAADES